jgi:hypothetical protein
MIPEDPVAAASISAWNALEREEKPEALLDSGRLENLPASSHVAVLALKRLGFSGEALAVNAPKIHGRPIPEVYRFVMAAEEEKPEIRQHLLTGFSRNVSPVGEDGRIGA